MKNARVLKIMTTTYILGSFLLWMPTILVNLAKQDGSYVKYAIAAIFTMLCERTAGMLSNLMNAEEQECMIEEMRLMQEKSDEIRSFDGVYKDQWQCVFCRFPDYRNELIPKTDLKIPYPLDICPKSYYSSALYMYGFGHILF